MFSRKTLLKNIFLKKRTAGDRELYVFLNVFGSLILIRNDAEVIEIV